MVDEDREIALCTKGLRFVGTDADHSSWFAMPTGKTRVLFTVHRRQVSSASWHRPESQWLIGRCLFEENSLLKCSAQGEQVAYGMRWFWLVDNDWAKKTFSTKNAAILYLSVTSGEKAWTRVAVENKEENEDASEKFLRQMSMLPEEEMNAMYAEAKIREQKPNKSKVLCERLCKWIESAKPGCKCEVRSKSYSRSRSFDAHLIIDGCMLLAGHTGNGRSHWRNLLVAYVEGSKAMTPAHKRVSFEWEKKLWPLGQFDSVEELELKMSIAGF